MATANLNKVLTREQLASQMEADGMEIGRPPHVGADCIAMDRETATEGRCDSCGHAGLEFLPYRPQNARHRGYRAIAWCPACDAAFEM
jgi:hypothetical protein